MGSGSANLDDRRPHLARQFVVGPLARSTADARLMFDVLAAHGRTAPTRGPLKILVVERFGDAPVEPLLADRCRQVAADLKALGHAVTFGPLPFEIDDADRKSVV